MKSIKKLLENIPVDIPPEETYNYIFNNHWHDKTEITTNDKYHQSVCFMIHLHYIKSPFDHTRKSYNNIVKKQIIHFK